MSDFFERAFDAPMTRRRLIKGIAAAGAATWAASVPGLARAASGHGRGNFDDFRAIAPSAADELQVPDGYAYDVLIKWGDEFGEGLRFGFNCDYSTFFPFSGRGDEGVIFVSHEYIEPFYVSDWRHTPDNNATWDPRVEPYKTLMEREKKEVGGSLIHIARDRAGSWHVVHGSRFNRRFYADGPEIPYTGPAVGSGLLPEGDKVLGTIGNCSGCHTPWGTVLTCEENPQSYGLKRGVPLVFSNGWIRDTGSEEGINYYVGEPGTNALGEPAVVKPDYGYVTEIDPFTGEAVKHTALGRFHHENVAIRIGPGGHVVAYSGDDSPAATGMFFKFVSARPYRPGMRRADAMRLLADGRLYVAQWLPTANNPAVSDSGTGVWHPLDMSPESVAFTTRWVEDNVVTQVGGTPDQFRVPRAEDCEVVPNDGRKVLIALTSARGRPADPAAFGVVRMLEEDGFHGDNRGFRWVDLLKGGEDSGFASPDNLGFSGSPREVPRGVWVVTDISTSQLPPRQSGPFLWHANNAMFYVPLDGGNANTAFRFANAPIGAELTGPTFNLQQGTLFVNVQHPGEQPSVFPSPTAPDPADVLAYPSWWPEGNRTAGTNPAKPKPSLVAVRKL
jgi:uncharacterized protein